jgi:hypothetical protein
LIFNNNNNLNNTTMKTKHFLLLSLVLGMAISALQAQVRIGDLSAPRPGVSLDLNRSNNTATTGLGLPVVTLTAVTSPLPLNNSIENLKGVIVYNNAEGNGLVKGLYFVSEGRWIRILTDGATASAGTLSSSASSKTVLMSGDDSAPESQVRIGNLTASRPGVSLDLNGDGNTATTGLGLPVVMLTALTDPQPLADSFDNLQGVIVYNERTENGLTAGLHLVDGDKWVRILTDDDVSDFTIEDLPQTAWLGADGSESSTLTIKTSLANESTLTYQWYYLETGENKTPVLIESSNAKTFNISNGTNNYNLTSAGEVKKYYCVVTNGSNSVKSTHTRAVYGTGVFLDNDKWLNMLSYNLGVSDEGKSLTPAQQYDKNSNDATIAGYLFQWGRAEDGHQFRDTSSVSPNEFLYHGVRYGNNGVVVDATSGQVTSDQESYGKFILRGDSPYDWRIYDATVWDSASDPCSGLDENNKTWRLPTSSEWSQIYTNNYPECISNKGLRFRPDGTNVSVFLPVAGYRSHIAGGLYGGGAYWSSTAASGDNALSLYFIATLVYPTDSNYRAYGYSVRCVSEQ